MKYNLLIIFLIFRFFIFIKSKESIKQKKESSKEKEINKEENEETSETKGEKEKEKENHMMTEEEFEEKLKKILEEKRIRKNMKITKDKLKEIFEAIYEKDFELPNIPEDLKEGEDNTEVDPKEDSKRFLNEIFYKLARSLDYDDEISPNQIKEYISPERVKVVVGEIVEHLIEVMGDL